MGRGLKFSKDACLEWDVCNIYSFNKIYSDIVGKSCNACRILRCELCYLRTLAWCGKTQKRLTSPVEHKTPQSQHKSQRILSSGM
jgi:hypothetical protein